MIRPDQDYLDTLTENAQRYIAELEAEVERLRAIVRAVVDVCLAHWP